MPGFDGIWKDSEETFLSRELVKVKTSSQKPKAGKQSKDNDDLFSY